MRRLNVVAWLLVLSTCADSASTEPLSACTGEVTVSVSSGTTPTFSWTPRCKIMFLLVEPADAGTDLWLTYTEDTNGIRPGVRYGVVPAGAVGMTAVSLEQGVSYKVVLYRFIDPDSFELIGVQFFTP